MTITPEQFSKLATKEDLKNLATKDDVREVVKEETKNFATKDDLNSLREEHEEQFIAIKKDLSKLDKLDSIEKVTKATFELVSGKKEEKEDLKGRVEVAEKAIEELKKKKGHGVVYQSID